MYCSVDMFLFYATLLEESGAETQARQVYANLLQAQASHASDRRQRRVVGSNEAESGQNLEVVFRAADFERRVLGEQEAVEAVCALYDSAMRSTTCRAYINTVICKKAIFLSNCPQFGGIKAGLRVLLARGKEVPSNSPDRRAWSSSDVLGSIDNTILQTALQCDADLSVVKCIFDMLLRLPSSSLRDDKVRPLRWLHYVTP